MPGPLENSNIKKFYQQSAKPFNYVPNDLVDGVPVLPPVMSGLMRIDPSAGNIWISAGNTLVSDWKLITGGGGGGAVTSIIAGTNISITSTGPGGTGAVTINSAVGPESQSLQDVIKVSNVLTQNNIILGTGTSLAWNGNTYFQINPDTSGYFRAAVGKYPPSYSELYVEDTYAQMFSEGSTNQIVKVDTTNVYIQTPSVSAGSATAGQVLTLGNPLTGAVEYTTISSSGLPVFTANQDVNIGSGYDIINDLTFPLVTGKSYSFKATISYVVPSGGTDVSWRYSVGSSTPIYDAGIAICSGNVKNVSSSIATIYLGVAFPEADFATIEGVIHEVQADDNFYIRVSFTNSFPPAFPAVILKGSTLVYYEI